MPVKKRANAADTRPPTTSGSASGESAAVPALASRYVQLGARSLSMAAPSIPEVKDALLELDLRALPFTPPLPPAVEALQNG